MKVKEAAVQRGNFFMLFTNGARLKKFAGCILIGLPIWYVIGILITFSPEFAKTLGVAGDVVAGDAVMYSYLALAVGDFGSGFISQMVQSRKKLVLIFILLTMGSILLYLFPPFNTVTFFYITCGILGFSIGYWALFVTIAAEQFGTNLRSTVATTVPNFIRGTVVPITLAFKFFRDDMGIVYAALIVGVITVIIALIALTSIDETFSRDMNYLEEK